MQVRTTPIIFIRDLSLISRILTHPELSDDLKQKCAASVLTWQVYPIKVFILDITMQNLVDLVKFVTLALKTTDPELQAMRFCDVRFLTRLRFYYF
jgi:hypothetical protein